MNNEQPTDTTATAAMPRRERRGSRSQRRMTRSRRLLYKLAIPVGMGLIWFFWLTCRIVRVQDGQALERRMLEHEPVILCYWHRHQLFCWRYIRKLMDRGARVGWLISASLDGEVPTEIAKRMGGGRVFRGSTTSRGTQALRAMHKAIVHEKISLAATPDGPYGPRSRFKPGIVKLSQLSGAPLVPLAYAARRAWVLKSWDRFVIPKPFTSIIIAVGSPVSVPRAATDADIGTIQRQLEQEMQVLFEAARRFC